MNAFDLTRYVIALVCVLGLVMFAFVRLFMKNMKISGRLIARSGVFSAIAVILYIVPYLKFPLPFFPSFLEFHFDEVPALIAGFAYGPLASLFVILIKTLVKLPMTGTACVGEVADFLYSLAFVLPASLIYRKIRNFKGALLSLLVSTVIQILFASVFTSFVMLDFYVSFMGLTKEILIMMCQKVNPNVTSLGWTFCFYVGIPFNALKDAMVIILTLLLYKQLHKLIDRIAI